MNSLSWLLYIADVIGNIKGVLIAFSIFLLVVLIVSWFFRALVSSDGDYKEGGVLHSVTSSKLLYSSIVIFPLIAAIIPSSTTIYMIAASEAGEVVVKSEEAREIFTGIKGIIKNKLKEVAP